MRYLIIKTSAFGDIIHAYSVLEYIKQLDPAAEVDWVVEKRIKELVSSHPLVSECIEVDTKKWRSSLFSKTTRQEIQAVRSKLTARTYDAVFDLQGNIKSALITAMTSAKTKVGYGFKTAPEAISALAYTKRYNPPSGQNIRSDYLFLVESYFNQKQVLTPASLLKNSCIDDGYNDSYKHCWLIAPGSNWINKQITPTTLEAFLQLCKDHYNPTFAFLSGSDQELSIAHELQQKFPGSKILHKPSLTSLQHIMTTLHLVISMDSLPLHLAATANCPTFAFFGPSSSQKYNPLGISHGSFQGPCPYGMTFERRCSKLRTCPTGACLHEVSPQTLFSAFQSWKSKSLS